MPGLQVLIVGGSIGGLATALALRSQGHYVTIYEHSHTPNNTGAGITMYPNALSALEALGVNLAQVRATRVQEITQVLVNTDGTTQDGTVKQDVKSWPWHNTTYQDLYTSMWEAIHDTKQPGPKVEFHSGKPVYRVNPAKGIIYFVDGTEAQGDVIIGADGVHSVCRSFVFSGRTERFRLQRHIFRATIPADQLVEDPRTAKLLETPGLVSAYHLQDKAMIFYPASDNQALCVKLMYEDSMAIKNLSKDWRDPSSKRKLMRLAQGFPTECVAALEKIRDRDLLDQPVWDMDPLLTFQSHRLALVGDAAHPMPPYCGQRIAMALEDALCLNVLLESDISASDVADRLKLYSRTRKVRAVAVQQTMRGMGEINLCDLMNSVDPAAFHTYIFSHDEQAHTRLALSAWKKQQFLDSSVPIDILEERRPSAYESTRSVRSRRTMETLHYKKWWSARIKSPKPWSKVFG